MTPRQTKPRPRRTGGPPHSVDLYRTLAQHFPNGAVLLFDHDLRYTLADGAGLAQVGLSKELLEGKTIWELFPPETSSLLEPHYRAALAGTEASFEVPFAGRVYLVRTLPIRDERGSVAAGMAMTQDITASKQAEAALQASEAELRALFAAMPDVILALDREGRYVEIAPTNPSLLYKPAEDLLGQTLHDVLPADRADEFLGYIQRALEARVPVQAEYSLPVGGRDLWFAVTVSPLTDERVLWVARDITAARQSEQALREREREYRSIFESGNDGLLIYDLTGRQVDFNPAAARMFGYTVEEFRHLEAERLVHPASSEMLRKFGDTLRAAREFRARGRMRRKDGTTFPADVRGTPFSYRGQPRVLAIVRDVSEEAAAYDLLEQRVQERTAELSGLLGVAQEMVSTLTLKDLLALVLQQLRLVVDYTGASIFSVDDGRLTILDYQGPLPRERVMARHYWVEPGAGYEAAIVRRQPVIIPNVWGDTPLAQALQAARGPDLQAEFGGTRSWMGVPLLLKERLIGFLSLEHAEPDHFTEQHARLALAFAQHAAVAMENARLFGTVEERTRELSALLDVSKNVVSTLELSPLLTHILKNLRAVVDYTGAAIAELDQDAFVILDYLGPTPREQMRQLRISASVESGYKEVARRREPVIVGDIWADEPWLRQVREESGEWMRTHFGYAHAWLGVPLLIKDRLIGVLRLDHVEPDHFTELHARLALAFAQHAAVAIQNARLFEAGQRRAEQFRVINEVGQRIASILDVDELLSQTARLTREAFGYYHVHIGLIEDGQVVFKTVGAGPPNDPHFAHCEAVRLQVGQEGLTGWVAASGEPVLVQDVRQDPRFVAAADDPTLAELVVPIKVKGTVIGVLSIESDRAYAFDDSDLAVAQTLASQVAVAIENARLYAAEQRRADQFRAITEVGQRITSLLAVEELLFQTEKLIREIFGYYYISIGLVEGDELIVKTDCPCDRPRLKVGEEGVMGWVAATGQPLLVPDTSQEPRYIATISSTRTRSELALPIKLKDQTIGVLNVESERLNDFDDSDLAVLHSLANQLAVAIENARLYEQAGQLAALEERQKLARELHDSVSQALYGIALGARTARTLLDRDPAAATAKPALVDPLEYVLSLAEAGLAEMRALIFELRPESLRTEGLVAALHKQADSLRARHRLDVRTAFDPEPDILLEAKEALYRVAQEALHNIAKHARASQVDVRLSVHDGDLRLEIGDDGVGFDPSGEFPGHLGLRSMRERAERLGATFALESAPGKGTRLCVQLPLRA